MSHRWQLLARDEICTELVLALTAKPRTSQMLRGPSGIGKTTIAAQVGAELTAAGRTVVPIVALAELQQIPLGAVAPILANERMAVEISPSERLSSFISLLAAAPSDFVLLVDDAPLLDSVTAAAIYQLVRVYGISALLTARDSHALTGPIERLVHEDLLQSTELSGLSLDETRRMLASNLGRSVNPETVIQLHSKTTGNPLFLRELVRAGLRDRSLREGAFGIEFDESKLPEHLLTSINDRLGTMGESARRLLRLICFTQPWPLAALRRGDHAALLELLDVGAVTETIRHGAPHLSLGHPLYAESKVLGSASSLAEDMLEAADRLEAVGDDQYRFTAICLRAKSGIAVQACADLVWASSCAHALGDYGMAVRLAQQAVELEQNFSAHLTLASAHSALGNTEAAESAFISARAGATTAREHTLLTLHQGRHLAYRRGEPLAAADLGAAALSDIDDSGRAILLPELRKWRLMAGDPDGLRGSDSATEHVAERTAAEVAEIVSAAVGEAMLATVSARAHEARAAIDSGRPLAELAIDTIPFASDLLDLSEFLALVAEARVSEAGDFAVSCRGASRADASGQWSYALAILQAQGGETSRAAELAALAVEQLSWRDFTGLLGAARALHATLLAQLDQCDEARAVLARLTQAHRSDVKVMLQASEAEAWLLFSSRAELRGRSARATSDAAVSPILEAARLALDFRHELLAAISLGLVTRLGRPEAAAPLLREAAESSKSPFIDVLAEQAELLCAGQGEALIDITPRLLAAGHVAVAIDGLILAENRAVRAGRKATAVRAAARRREVTAHAVLAQRPTESAADRLTPREWEIALAAADRERSREIASKLSLSSRTVDNHLANIYRKLGVTGRDELVAALAKLRRPVAAVGEARPMSSEEH